MRFRFWSEFILGVFGTILCCWNISFNAIALPLKVTFNLTQSEVEVVSAMSNIGLAFGISEPFISGKFGYSTSYTLAWIISPIPCFLSFLAVRYKALFHQWVWFLGGFQFLSTSTTNFLEIQIISISINKFSKEHTGKLIGLYTGAGAFAKIFYAGCFELFFEGDLGGFYLFVSIVWAVVFGACVLLHRRRDPEDTESVTEEELNKPLENKGTSNQEGRETAAAREMFTSPHFHLIVWSYACMYGCIFAYMNNVTSIGDSLGMAKPEHLIYTLSICISVCRVASGVLLDKMKTLTSSFGLVIMCHLIYITALFMLLVQFSEAILYVVTVLIGVSMIACNPLPLTLLVKRFGRPHYGIIFGVLNIFGPLMAACYQFLIGFLYDSEAIRQNSDNFCKGTSCFSMTFVIFLLSGVFASILHVINFYLERRVNN